MCVCASSVERDQKASPCVGRLHPLKEKSPTWPCGHGRSSALWMINIQIVELKYRLTVFPEYNIIGSLILQIPKERGLRHVDLFFRYSIFRQSIFRQESRVKRNK